MRKPSLDNYAFGHLLLGPSPYPEELHCQQTHVLETLASRLHNPFARVLAAERNGKVFNGGFAAVGEKDVYQSPDESTECQSGGFWKMVENFFQETYQKKGGVINKETKFQLLFRIALDVHSETVSFGDDTSTVVTSTSFTLPFKPFNARDPTFCSENRSRSRI